MSGMTCGLVGFLSVLLLVPCIGITTPAWPPSDGDTEFTLDATDEMTPPSVGFAVLSRLPWSVSPFGLLFPLVPGRVKKERLLDHPVRRRILEEVSRNPGIHHRELLRTLDLSNGTLAYHLGQLERAGYLHFARAHGRKLLWVTEDEVDEEFLLMTERDRELFAMLEEVEAARLDELGSRCGLKASGVGYHMDRLRELGFVEAHREGHALVLSCVPLDLGTPKVCTTNHSPT